MDRFLDFLKTVSIQVDIEDRVYSELMENFEYEETLIIRDQWLNLRKNILSNWEDLDIFYTHFYNVKKDKQTDIQGLINDLLILINLNCEFNICNDKSLSKDELREIINKMPNSCNILSIIEKVIYDRENGYFNKVNFDNDKEMFEEVMNDLKDIYNKIETLQNKVKYDSIDELVTMDINRNDPDSLFWIDEITSMCRELGDIKYKIGCLEGTVCFHGVVSKDSDGNYKLSDGAILKKGQTIECLVNHRRMDLDEECERVFWTKAKIIEKSDGELGLEYYDNMNLDGLFYRERKY